ncbi:hypothetical protein GLOTRDRAFT_111381 [Gloeophyllum trabeum ATCC 11539]|uniref:Uncharacterized protein n=1 Tax=Gloeophyllum trabeum (strain ATCC 11539 / FP-39264 / Madison 617) TaxID=670483 RepID=S7Q3X9_GLOTA|nr:uncharacterized protein GLOTRDRAFT_111381 [Gloeophyllum trabeum ATCC 11539]EPQ54711.1 hypothetical protein GLOTRDRAFT_111381 [Gloeophyllum trabeum ATCC 11539]
MVELLTSVVSARRTSRPALQAAKLVPTLPIPIPTSRRATGPPSRSPTRKDLSSDLLFDMSPPQSSGIVPSPPTANGSQKVIGKHASPRRSPLDDFNLVDVSRALDKVPTPEEMFLYTLPTLAKPSANMHSANRQSRVKSAYSPHRSFDRQTKAARRAGSHARHSRADGGIKDNPNPSSFDSLSGSDLSQSYGSEAPRRSPSVSHVKITGFVTPTKSTFTRYPPQRPLSLAPVSADKTWEHVR